MKSFSFSLQMLLGSVNANRFSFHSFGTQYIASQHFFFSFFLISFIFASCQTPDVAPKIVAEWNGIVILEDEFQQEYRQFASFSSEKDDLETRKEYALQMLERKIIGKLGEKASLIKLPDVKAHIERQRNLALRRHYLDTAIGKKIPQPDEKAIRQAFDRSNTRLNLQQIFASSQKEADSLYTLLQKNNSFDELATSSMRRYGVPNPEQAGKMGWISWNEMDIAPENVVFSLQRGQFSKPVASLKGWHIFKLLDIEQKVVLDATTYQNQREKLQFQIHQRQYDEASMAHLKTLLTAQRLMMDLRVLNPLWADIAPLVANTNDPVAVATMNKEVTTLKPKQINRNQAVAFVNNKPFTVGQFLKGLPDVPRGDWQPNLRIALQTVIRDSVLTAKALEAKADTAQSVALETRMATQNALFYATLRAAADTLNYASRAQWFYETMKETQFIANRSTQVRFYTFPDSSAAWRVIRLQAQTQNWEQAVQQAGVSIQQRDENIVSQANDASEKAVLFQTLPLSNPKNRQWSGPFFYEGKWVMLEAMNRSVNYRSFEEVKDSLPERMRAQIRMVVEKSLLPREYSSSQVTLNEDVLKNVLPMA